MTEFMHPVREDEKVVLVGRAPGDGIVIADKFKVFLKKDGGKIRLLCIVPKDASVHRITRPNED